MNFWEKLSIGLIAAAEQTAPIFIHSKQGMVILNASEVLLGNVLGAIQKPSAESPGPVAINSAA